MRNLLLLAAAVSANGLLAVQKAAKESAAEPESSPDSPLVQNEPSHEDEEQPVVLTRG